jgi:gamma-glutamylaminecyclotransferase
VSVSRDGYEARRAECEEKMMNGSKANAQGARSGRGRARGRPGTRKAKPTLELAEARTHVFVYGSLRKGEFNHRLLAVPGARLIMAKSRTEPGYELRDLGAFPGMVRGGAGAVIGEVYEVDEATLAALDRLEGHPRFYSRTRIALDDGTIVEAYLLSPGRVMGRPVIPTGDWRAHRRDRAKVRDFDDDTEAG